MTTAAYNKYYKSLICLKWKSSLSLFAFQKQSASQYYHKQVVHTAEEAASNGTEYLVAHGGSCHSFTCEINVKL